jgi:hypothetical protein
MSVDITARLLNIDTFSGLEGCGAQIAKAVKTSDITIGLFISPV